MNRWRIDLTRFNNSQLQNRCMHMTRAWKFELILEDIFMKLSQHAIG